MDPTSDFPDTGMSGRCFSPAEGVVASGQIVSACSVVPSVAASDGSGTPKTMSGPRYTLNSRKDGYMSMRVKRLGIILASTQKVSSSLVVSVNAATHTEFS